jgi:DNA modification methylase
VKGIPLALSAEPVASVNVNRLFYGDNLGILRDQKHFPDECVDLIYLDPPFNSKRVYNVLFKSPSGADSEPQIHAFEDSWTWTQQTSDLYDELIGGGAPLQVASAMQAMYRLLGKSDVNAYLVMMAIRLVEMHRVLKPTGSLYLHCDPTASHYLKVMLDAVFGPEHFRNEIVWKRTPFSGSSKARAQQLPRSHDIILFYSSTDDRTWNGPTLPYGDEYLARFKWDDGDGRGPYRKTLLKTYSDETFKRLESDNRLVAPVRAGAKWSYKQYLAESSGTKQIDDTWMDINSINPVAQERLGYPTQKPIALLERIIAESSNEGDVVLDPFCGCGTAVDAAQGLHRRWIGIDISILAVELIQDRMERAYESVKDQDYEVRGVPNDLESAQTLFDYDPFEFERWAVLQVEGQPNDKQRGDQGYDGLISFHTDTTGTGSVAIQVKGGKHVGPDAARSLRGTMERFGFEMGLLIILGQPTPGVQAEIDQSESYVNDFTGTSYPKLQVLTIADLFAGQRPRMPTPINPFFRAKRTAPKQMGML